MITRYWSDVDGRFIDCEVVWNGRDPLPGIGGITRRKSYLADGEPHRPARQMQRRYVPHATADGRLVCGCGRLIAKHDADTGCLRCKVCRDQQRNLKRPSSPRVLKASTVGL